MVIGNVKNSAQAVLTKFSERMLAAGAAGACTTDEHSASPLAPTTAHVESFIVVVFPSRTARPKSIRDPTHDAGLIASEATLVAAVEVTMTSTIVRFACAINAKNIGADIAIAAAHFNPVPSTRTFASISFGARRHYASWVTAFADAGFTNIAALGREGGVVLMRDPVGGTTWTTTTTSPPSLARAVSVAAEAIAVVAANSRGGTSVATPAMTNTMHIAEDDIAVVVRISARSGDATSPFIFDANAKMIGRYSDGVPFDTVAAQLVAAVRNGTAVHRRPTRIIIIPPGVSDDEIARIDAALCLAAPLYNIRAIGVVINHHTQSPDRQRHHHPRIKWIAPSPALTDFVWFATAMYVASGADPTPAIASLKRYIEVAVTMLRVKAEPTIGDIIEDRSHDQTHGAERSGLYFRALLIMHDALYPTRAAASAAAFVRGKARRHAGRYAISEKS